MRHERPLACFDANAGFLRKSFDRERHLASASCAAVLERAALVTFDKAFVGLRGLVIVVPPEPIT